MSKCDFGIQNVEYLWHLITGKELDPQKINVMVCWLEPKILEDLRGLLRLNVYYRKFIKDYGMIGN
jgi:hypothetical protein